MTPMADPLRLVFMGSDPIALPLLDWLAGDGRGLSRLVAVVTGPDRPAGRGQAVGPNAVKAWAAGRPLEILQPEAPDAGTVAALSALKPDVALVVAYGHILRDGLISVPRLGTLNLHASLLPRYRGASPIQSAVASGDARTGMTLMRIVSELDAGPIGDVEPVDIAPLDTASEVEAKLAACSVPLVARAFALLGGEGSHSGPRITRSRATAAGSPSRTGSWTSPALRQSSPRGSTASIPGPASPWTLPGLR